MRPSEIGKDTNDKMESSKACRNVNTYFFASGFFRTRHSANKLAHAFHRHKYRSALSCHAHKGSMEFGYTHRVAQKILKVVGYKAAKVIRDLPIRFADTHSGWALV